MKSMTESNQQKLLEIHQTASKSLVDFFYVFQSDPNRYCEPAFFHHTVSDILLHEKKNFAVEMFRESAKTSYVLKAFPLYRLTYPSEDSRYIVIIKNNQELASGKLAEIANEYTNNAILNQNLVEVKRNSSKVFEVVVRGQGRKDYTVRIEAYGKGASIRGLSWGILRPQIVICDDLQDLEDAESETVTEKDWNWFLSDVNFLAKDGRIFIIGNNLGERCIIERIFNSDVLEFDKLKIPALQDGKATWPEAFSKEFLEAEKEKYAALDKIGVWYRERMCIALPEEKQVFKKKFFKYFDPKDIHMEDKQLEYYITVDLAISQKQDADDTVLCVVGKEMNGPNWYIMEFEAGKLTPIETIDALFYLYEKYRPVRVGVESVAYQKALSYFIEEEQRKRRIYFTVTDLKSINKKEERIKGLQPMFSTGVIHHQKHMTKFEAQLLAFPTGLHDDYIDALSMQIDLMQNTVYRKRGVRKGRLGYVDPLKRF